MYASERTFGNMSSLPPRQPSEALRAEASAHADQPEAVRLELATVLIGKSRTQWHGTEDDVWAGLDMTPAEYWEGVTAEPMKADHFAQLLHIHLIDPTEKPNPFDPRGIVKSNLHSALRLAIGAGESFIIKGESLADALIRPREAALWLLSSPKRRELIPPSLRNWLTPVSAASERNSRPIPLSRKAGRPTRKDEIKKAYIGLPEALTAGKRTKVYDAIREKITGTKAPSKGLGDEAIRRAIDGL